MNHGSLFSGIGGFDLAAEWMGWNNVFHCEWNPFGRKVLNHYWPNSISYEDITKTDFSVHRGRIDILTGGFPCQPYSMAGKRLGKDDERHLWPEMLRAIREISPRWVVGENVFGLVNWNGGMVFDEVQADLEAQGYEVQPFVLPACAVNAPHRRDRVWFVAYARCDGFGKRASKGICKEWKEPIYENHNNMGNQGKSKTTPDTDKCTKESSRTSEEIKGNRSKNNDEQSCWRKQAEQHIGRSEFLRPTPDTESKSSERMRPQQRKSCESEQGEFGGINSENVSYRNATDTASCGRGQIGGQRESKFLNETGEIGNWQNFPTQSPICSGDDGLSSQLDGITFSKWRNESIKAYGNAIVPQVVYQIFKSISIFEQNA